MTPFEAGFEAFMEGHLIDSNPFELDTEESDAWLTGWYAASDADQT